MPLSFFCNHSRPARAFVTTAAFQQAGTVLRRITFPTFPARRIATQLGKWAGLLHDGIPLEAA
jgi:hypothetical protein